MYKLTALLLFPLLFLSCAEEQPGDLNINVTPENCQILDVHTEFDQDGLQDLTGLSEQDSINVNFEITGKSVLFTLINNGKNTVYLGKESTYNPIPTSNDEEPFKLAGTKFENLTMITVTLTEEQALATGEKYQINISFEDYGNYLVGFLYHLQGGGNDIMNIRWKYSEIIDLSINDQN